MSKGIFVILPPEFDQQQYLSGAGYGIDAMIDDATGVVVDAGHPYPYVLWANTDVPYDTKLDITSVFIDNLSPGVSDKSADKVSNCILFCLPDDIEDDIKDEASTLLAIINDCLKEESLNEIPLPAARFFYDVEIDDIKKDTSAVVKEWFVFSGC